MRGALGCMRGVLGVFTVSVAARQAFVNLRWCIPIPRWWCRPLVSTPTLRGEPAHPEAGPVTLVNYEQTVRHRVAGPYSQMGFSPYVTRGALSPKRVRANA
jgi:hypothetical protein